MVQSRFGTTRRGRLNSVPETFLENLVFVAVFIDTKRAWKERTVEDYYVALNRVVGSNSDLEPNWINIYNNIIDVIYKVFEFSFYKIVIIIITTTTLVCPPY